MDMVWLHSAPQIDVALATVAVAVLAIAAGMAVNRIKAPS
jgi:hypothetical protein